MSHDRKYANSYSGHGDTEFILASVKEQEIQFEKLTRELEEEHITVANQLEQLRVKSPDAFGSRYENNEKELSDTESKRDSSLEAVESPMQNGVQHYDSDCNDPDAIDLYYNHGRPTIDAKMLYTQPYYGHSTPYRQYPYQSHVRPVSVAHPRPTYVAPHHNPNARYPPQSHPTMHAFQDIENHPIPITYVPADWLYKRTVQPDRNHHQNERLPVHRHHNADSAHGSNYLHQFPAHYHHPPTNTSIPSRSHYATTHSMHNVEPQVHPPHRRNRQKSPPPVPPRKSSTLQGTQPPVLRYYQSNPELPRPVHGSNLTNNYSYAPDGRRTRREIRRSLHISAESQNWNNESAVTERRTSHSPPVVPRLQLDITPKHAGHNPLTPSSDPVEIRHRARTMSLSPRHTNHHQYQPNAFFSFNQSPEINQVIQMLRHPSYQVVSNAAAYIQHVTFADDNMKAVIRRMGVIPLLVNLLHHHVIEVQRNACGALRNMIYGRSNDDAKLIVRNCGGVSSLTHVLNNTEDTEMKELISGVLWNLSSCDVLKTPIADTAVPVLVSRIVLRYVNMLEPDRFALPSTSSMEFMGSHTDLTMNEFTIDNHWTSLFVNATGCLRNVSSAGVEVRCKLRSCVGLVEAMLVVLESVIGKNEVDSKSVENCMCVLRNLSYRLAMEVDAAHVPMSRDAEGRKDGDKDEDCWGRKKDRKRRSYQELSEKSSPSNKPVVEGAELLWQPNVVRRYLAILSETCNFETLEAAAGALQNLSAGQWVWAANIRLTVRKEKGLPMLVEFLHMQNDRIVTVMCSALRNMALDSRNKELLGKHAMQDFVELLPEVELSPNYQVESSPTAAPALLTHQRTLQLEAACGALRELVTSNLDNSMALYNTGGVPRLIAISKSTHCRYPQRLIQCAGRVLSILWENKSMRSALKGDSWSQSHFTYPIIPSYASVGSQVSPYTSPASLSPEEQRPYRVSTSYASTQSNIFRETPLPSPRNHTQSPPISPHMKLNSPHAQLRSPEPNYVTLIGPEGFDSWV